MKIAITSLNVSGSDELVTLYSVTRFLQPVFLHALSSYCARSASYSSVVLTTYTFLTCYCLLPLALAVLEANVLAKNDQLTTVHSSLL